MSKKPLCIICNKKEATVRDRDEAPWGKRKKLCADCHSERLENDVVTILEIEKKRILSNRSLPSIE